MKDLTFILTYSHDTSERIKNYNLILNYYKNLYPDSTFNVVEQGINKTLEPTDNVNYFFIKSEKTFNKCIAYNLGLSKTTTDIACFLDVDCIVSKESLDKAVEKSKNTSDIYIGYNGTCIYFEYIIKNSIKTTDLYNELIKHVDVSNLYTNFSNEKYLVGNTRAVGGCLVGQTKIFKDINGFNPNIIGWGYEDNEVVLRAHKLGYHPHYIITSKPILLHLPHYESKTDRSLHNNYQNNEKTYRLVQSLSKEELLEYIKTWKLI